jgi:chemotaxis protein CheX
VQPDLACQLDQAVAEVLAVMLHLGCTSEPLESRPAVAAVNASVHFTGSFDGICTLALDHPTAAELTASLTGIPRSRISSELCLDTAGELCNMIAGNWKGYQSRVHDTCQISCPTVSYDQVATSSFRQTIARLYRFAGGHFSLTLSLS